MQCRRKALTYKIKITTLSFLGKVIKLKKYLFISVETFQKHAK